MRFDFIHAHIPKKYDPEILVQGFETFEIAQNRQQHLIEVLRRFGSNCDDLVRRLEDCNEDHRCKSAACPVCLRHFRKWWCSRVTEFLDRDDSVTWHTINIIDPRQAYPIGELKYFTPQKMKDCRRKQFDRSNLWNALVAGGIDVNLTHYKDERRSPKWYPHLHVLTSSGGARRIEAAFKRHCPSSTDVRRPLIVNTVSPTIIDRARATTYSFKATFSERDLKTRDDGHFRKSYPPIPDEHMPELASALDTWGFGQRLIRRGHADFLPEMRVR